MSPVGQQAAWDLPTPQDVQEPLLPKHTAPFFAHQQHEDPQQQHSRMPGNRQDDQYTKQQQRRQATVDLGSRFLRRLGRILCIINATPALSLVLISLAETIIVSKIGTISGLFYQVFVDGQASQVAQLMLWSAGCYTATALFYSFKSGLQDFFAWRWRASLTVHLQRMYCANIGSTCPMNKAPLLQFLDSPDQRIAQDLPLLTASLSEVLTQLAAVPFNIIWYTHLTRQVFGSWMSVLCAYLFFLLGVVLQRLVMLPVASAVFQQEAAEGAFRYAHTRFRAWAAEIAMYRSEPVEQQHLEGQLSRVLVCQGRLMLRRAVLTATSRLLEYGGLVVNFGCLAAAVFGGAWSGPGQSAGDIASKVSIASFYLLTLIYNFSQVLDLASKVANLAGLTARVSQMLEALTDTAHSSTSASNQRPHYSSSTSSISSGSQRRGQGSNRGQGSKQALFSGAEVDYSAAGSQLDRHDAQQQHSQQQQQQQQQQPLQEVAAGKSPSHQRYASQAVLLQAPQLVLVPVPGTPAAARAGDAGGRNRLNAPAAGTGGTALAARGDTVAAPEGTGQVDQSHQPDHHQQLQQQQQQQTFTASMTKAEVMQVSIHSMGADMLLQEVRRAFPGSPRLAPLLAVVTFQFCGAARTHMLHKLQQQQQQQGVNLPQAAMQYSSSTSNSGSSSSGVQGDCCQSCASGAGGCEGSSGGSSSSGSSGGGTSVRQGLCADADMQHMLGVFMTWQQAVYDHITDCGYWCDMIDPRTGTALHSTPGSHYDEVIGASVLLGYNQVTPPGQTFSLISHPEAATQVYPATLFTSAPLPVVREALRAAAVTQDTAAAAAAAPAVPTVYAAGSASSPASSRQAAYLPSSSSSSSALERTNTPKTTLFSPQLQQQQLLLSCSRLSVRTPAGIPVVQGLSLQVFAGQSLLIQGPSGCGKSTLISCLAGLWPKEAGKVRVTDCGGSLGVMFVPQRPLAAPGLTLRQQLLYPAAASIWPCSCCTGSGTQQQQQQGVKCKYTQQQRRQQSQHGGGSSSSWWLNWLSCGLHRQLQQQQQLVGMSYSSGGGGTAVGMPAVLPAMGAKQQQVQQQLFLPTLPPAQSARLQQQQQLGLCASCQHMVSLLDSVGLSYLLSTLPNGLHTRQDSWGDVLSPGELQRLTFARVLLHRPSLVVLDEATSALPDAAAVQLYRELQSAGVSYVSVGHSRCLVDVHDSVLCVAGDGSGGWQIS